MDLVKLTYVSVNKDTYLRWGTGFSPPELSPPEHSLPDFSPLGFFQPDFSPLGLSPPLFILNLILIENLRYLISSFREK